MKGLGFCEICGKRRNVTLHGMDQGVKAGSGCEFWGHPLGEVWVNDSHLRGEAVVADWVLPAVGASNDRKWGNLRTRSRCGGHTDEILDFGTERREIHYPLPYVHEPRSQAAHRHVGVFIHQAHDLSCIDWTSTAKSNNSVRLEVHHSLHPTVDASYRRVGRDFIKYPYSHSTRLEHVEQGVDKPKGNHCPIRYDNGSHRALQITHRLSKDPAFEVDGAGHLEPEHVFTAFRHRLDMDEVLGADVGGHTASALSTAAKRQRWCKREVVYVADGPKGRWLIDEDFVGGHPLLKLSDAVTAL
mmetsp:Transcript_3474/g.8220  ORF Transcript_3474/g.8220 Transcript_3474/m.8220 type:complete len:300 (-) Transcript_3474:316-1215(-)